MMNKQNGIASLLLTSGLLLVTLVLTLASYQGTFLQIKQTQNTLAERQKQWIAEGGLECVYGLAKLHNKVPDDSEKCGLEGVKLKFTEEGSGLYHVQASYAGSVISKSLTYKDGQLPAGAILATANIHSRGSVDVRMPHAGEEKQDGWDCTVLRYAGTWQYENSKTIENKGLGSSGPGVKFNRNGKDCRSANKTGGTGKDWVKDPDISPFEDLFGVSKEEHDKVKQMGANKFYVIEGERTVFGHKFVKNCGTRISAAHAKGHRHIWVEGGCEINAALLNYKSMLLVVHDGPLAVWGAGTMRGVFVHFNHEYSPQKEHWSSFTHWATGTLSTYGDALVNNTSYYRNGSFNIKGLQVLDADNQTAINNNALTIEYQEDHVNEMLEPLNIKRKSLLAWTRGSWNDFE